MTKVIISHLLYLFDDAFQGPDWESLLTNLADVTQADWLWVPPGGQRSICEIVRHVGGCKYMYHNQAFGDRSFAWENPLVHGDGVMHSIPSAVDWLRTGHARLRESIVDLEDGDLSILRGHHSGKLKETHWIITTMIQHDLYHAGEINLIRALHQQNDS